MRTPGHCGSSRRATRPPAGRNPFAGILRVDARLDRVPRSVASPAGAERRPSAIASCARTRSTPVTASVTGCSTCSRAFISRKRNVPSGSSRNSTVPGADVAGGARRSRRRRRRAAARRSADTAGDGRLLEHLLVAALQRAVALAQVDHAAVRVGAGSGPRRAARRASRRSRNTRSSPNAAAASCRAARDRARQVVDVVDRAHPAARRRPPPP